MVHTNTSKISNTSYDQTDGDCNSHSETETRDPNTDGPQSVHVDNRTSELTVDEQETAVAEKEMTAAASEWKATEERNTPSVVDGNPSGNFTSAAEFWRSQYETFFRLSKEFVDVELSHDEKTKAVKSMVSFAKKLPHQTKYLSDLVSRLENAAKETENNLRIISEKKQGTENNLEKNAEKPREKIGNEELTNQQLINMLLMERKIFSIERDICEYIEKTSHATNKVNEALRAFSGLSQAEGTAHQQLGTGTLERVNKEIKEEKEVFHQCKKLKSIPGTANNDPQFEIMPMPATANKDDPLFEIMENTRDLKEVLSLELPKADSEKSKKLVKRLAFVGKCINSYFDAAEIIKHDHNFSSAKYKMTIQQSLDSFYEIVHNCLRLDKFDAIPTWSAQIVPGAYAFEVEGTEPWLSTITRLIGECLELPYQIVDQKSGIISPDKCQQRNQSIVTNTERDKPRATRRCDMMLTKDRRFVFLIYDDAMQLGGEAKPGSRKSTGPIQLLREAKDQGLSHAAKSVMVGFNFAGAGVPTHATVFVINMACIQVLQLRLKDVGTPDVKLVLYESKYHPLLGIEQYNKWAQSAAPVRMEDFTEMREMLYRTGDTGKNDGIDEFPSGLRVICALMRCRRKELFGPSIDAHNNILGDILGSGTFAVVFRHKEEESHVIKLSRYGRVRDLSNEAAILDELGEHSAINVAKLVHKMSLLEVSFKGNVTWKLPFIVTSPFGKSSLLACTVARASGKDSFEEWLLGVVQGLKEGLRFIHERKIVHFDVNPSNVIIHQKGQKEIPVLIDYSIAAKTLSSESTVKKLDGFRGTIDYAHADMFAKYPNKKWMVEKKYDLASLAFTMAVFANGGNRPWKSILGFPRSLKKEDKGLLQAALTPRHMCAKKIFELFHNDELKQVTTKLLKSEDLKTLML